VRDRHAPSEAERRGFATIHDRTPHYVAVQEGFRCGNAGHHVNNVPGVVRTQTQDHALSGDQRR
jgi:hypothetical protein